MKASPLTLLILTTFLVQPVAAQIDKFVKFPNGPKINFTVPMGYSFDAKNNTDGTITMRMDNPVWNIRIEALVAMDPNPAVTTRDWQQSKLIEHMAPFMSRAKETDYVFKPLAPAKGSGIYCMFSSLGADNVQNPEVGAYTHITGGVKAWAKSVVLFRILSTETKSPEYLEALELFNWSFSE